MIGFTLRSWACSRERTMPSILLRWFTQFTFGGAVQRRSGHDGDTLALYDRVDGHALDVGEFRASGSMLFRDAPENAFVDTVPAWAAPAPPARHQGARG
jgi:hypothetical protein